MSNPLGSILKKAQKSWALLAQGALWIFGIVAQFLLPPPIGDPETTAIWVHFARFVAAIILGFVLLASLRWRRKKDFKIWAAAAALFLVCGTASFFGYQYFLAHWTADYNQKTVVIGDSYTRDGQIVFDGIKETNKKTPSNADMLKAFHGEIEAIWPRSAIIRRQELLAAMYVATMPIMTVCVMAILQAVHCASHERKPRKAPSSHRRARAEKGEASAVS